MPDFIDKTAETIALNSEKIREKVIEYFIIEYEKVTDVNKAIASITNTNFTELILNDFGLQKELNKSLPAYKKVVSDTLKEIGRVDNVAVDAYFNIQQGYIYNHVRDAGVSLTNSLSKSIFGNVSIKQLKDELLQATARLSEAQINTLLNTTIRTYGSTVFADSAIKYAPNAKYKYVGVLDEKTRDVCRAALNDPRNVKGFTISEISTLDGVTFSDRGGFNCRHNFEKVYEK